MSGQPINMFVQGWADQPRWGVGKTNPPTRGVIEDIDVPHGADPDIVFTIVPTGTSLQFDTNDPIWVKPGGGCPKKHSKSHQIEVCGCSASTLTLKDRNCGSAHHLRYTLRFSNGESLDPIIKNGGGGPPHTRRSLAKVLIGAAVVAVAGFFAWKLFEGR